MPYQKEPTFNAVPYKMLEVPQPAIGGLDLKDLEFEQDNNQSPYMLNVMYRNGAFAKRYGQSVYHSFNGTVYSAITFDGGIFAHVGDKIYRKDSESEPVEVGTGMPLKKGLFITFAQKLYYMASTGLYLYDETFSLISDMYSPDFIINCKPDGSTGGNVIDDLNLLGTKFKISFNGEADVTEYNCGAYTKTDGKELADWSVRPTVYVNDEETNDFTVDSENKKITFATAPGEGSLNVIVEFTMVTGLFDNEKNQILNSKFYDTFGGANNSRLFVAGGGDSKYYYSQAYDITYFPENNFATIGNTEEDITGFGRQYNVLIVFKPKEIYSVYSYIETSSTTVIEENIGLESFRSQLVNARIGCDAPYSIQIVNNLLTWFNSAEGICTLVSTNVQDERNVRVISRNIERANSFGQQGLLDYGENPNLVQSADFENRYFLVLPTYGICYMWDYEISPFRYSSTGSETNPRELAWFMFDNFFVKQFLRVEKRLYYVSSHTDFSNSLIELNDSFADLDFNSDGENDAIHSFYLTPFMQFNAVEYLKNLKAIFVQCRGDTNTEVNIKYYTDDSREPENEPESIFVNGGDVLWNGFSWDDFHWFVNAWGNVFRRRCNLKKVQMCAIYFENNALNRDLSLTHIGLQYQIVKEVR